MNPANAANGGSQPTKGERTRLKILTAASDLFAERGYDRTSLRDVAAVVGIQEPGIYRYFDTKDALYASVLEQGLQPLLDKFDELFRQPPDIKIIRQLPAAVFDILAQHPQTARLLANAMTMPQSEAAHAPVRQWLDQLLAQGSRVMDASGFGDDPRLALFIVNMFNAAVGFFASDGLLNMLGESRGTEHQELLDIQRQFIASMAAIWTVDSKATDKSFNTEE